MQLAELINALSRSNVKGTTLVDIKQLSHDSKQVGADGLFVALKGAHRNGHAFVAEAIASGARAVIVEEETVAGGDVTVITVPDTRIALAEAADCFFGHPSRHLTVIGITGTNGKTTTTFLVESILKQAGYRPGVIGTIDYRFGDTCRPAPNTTPNALVLQGIVKEMVDAGVTHLIIEVSSHALEQHRVEHLDFDVAVFTNLSAEHLDYHGSMENYGRSKQLLFSHYLPRSSKGRKYALINYDDDFGKTLCTVSKSQLLRYGIREGIEISVKDMSLNHSGTFLRVQTPAGDVELRSSLIGSFNCENILAALSVAITQNIPLPVISQGITRLTRIPGRLEQVPNSRGLTILIDYAHTSDALAQVLDTLRALGPKRLITVFGCGGDRDTTKRGPMGDEATRRSDITIITSDNPRTENPQDIIEQIEAGIDKKAITKLTRQTLGANGHHPGYVIIPDRREAIGTAVGLSKPGDILLIAGKGHEDYQIIGTTRHRFSDREAVSSALSRLS
jgi:UDP-N-acetylmuramoyl-L-alanyl-D-glutamate--2,6-diaminopimelate ligase